MNKSVVAAVLALAALLSGCDVGGIRGNGHVVTQERPVTDFSEIHADGYFEIEWRPGAPSCSITVDDNLQQYIETSVDGNILKLHARERMWVVHRLKVILSSTTLHGAQLSGACRLDARRLTGSTFYVHSEGAAQITLDGNVSELLADTEGAAKLEAETLQTKTAQISSEGASKADVFATESLKVSISGAGKVVYDGDPKSVEKHVSGAGSIHKRE